MKAGVENGAMLTTYLFGYTPECTISLSNFQNFLRLGRQGGTDPLTKIMRTPLTLTLNFNPNNPNRNQGADVRDRQ